MRHNDDLVLSKLAEVISDMSRLAGMSFDEIWEAQFEGRSVTVVERTLEDGRTEMNVEFGDPNPDGSVVYTYRLDATVPSESPTSDGSAP